MPWKAQRRLRVGLVEERKREATTLVALQTERAQTASKGQQILTEAMPIQAVAAIFGVTDPDIAIRWLVPERTAGFARLRRLARCSKSAAF